MNNTSINKKSYNVQYREKGLRRRNDSSSIDYEFNPFIEHYREYLLEQNQNSSRWMELLTNFEKTQVNQKGVILEVYLQYLIDEKILQGDRELYSHLKKVLEFFVENNLLHLDKKNEYLKTLNDVLFSKNRENKIEDVNKLYKIIDYSQYNKSDFRKVHNIQILNELYNKGGEIYITNNNKIALKLSKNDEIKEYPIRTAERVLSNYFRFNIQITDEVLEYKDIDMDDLVFESSSYEISDITGKGE